MSPGPVRADRMLIVGATLLVLGLLAWGLTLGDYPANANVFPGLAAAAMVVFGLLALREPPPATDAAGYTWSAAFWLGAALPLIYLLGFRIGLPVYAFAYALARTVRPVPALILAAAIALTIELLFVQILHLPLDRGWLLNVLLKR